eukprot:scaffold488830_cov47-Prasinocladus_malaysianus.AAC.1
MGLGPGMISLAIMGAFAVTTLYMLSACKAAVRGEDYGGSDTCKKPLLVLKGNVYDMLRKMLGPGAAQAADILLALYAWGGGVTYMMILAKELKMVVMHVFAGASLRCEQS